MLGLGLTVKTKPSIIEAIDYSSKKNERARIDVELMKLMDQCCFKCVKNGVMQVYVSQKSI